MEKIKKMRGISILIMFIMVFQLIIPVNFAYAANDETSNTELIDGKIKIWDKNNILLFDSEDGGSPTDIPLDAKIQIGYKFFLEDGDDVNYEAGDWFTYVLPNKIKFEEVNNIPFVTASGLTSGTFSLSGNIITVKFTAVGDSDITVDLDVKGVFDKDNIQGGDELEINLGATGGIIKIGFKEPPKPSINLNTEKTGEFQSNGEILWTIKLNPSELAENVTITDIFDDSNQVYVEGSLTVNSVITSAAITGSAFTVSLGDISSPQIITFRTKPNGNAMNVEGKNNNEKVIFNNEVTSFIDGYSKDTVNAKVELDWIEKTGAEIVVTGFSGVRIKWTVKVENHGGFLTGNNAVIKDMLNSKLKLVEEAGYSPTINFGSGDIILGTVSTSSDGYYSYDNSTNLLNYHFNNTSTFDTAIFTYYTDVKNVDTDANNNSTITFDNTAELLWNANTTGPSDTTGNTGIGNGILGKSGVSEIDYVKDINDIITWTVTINRNGLNLQNAVFNDIIPKGLEYQNGTFAITGASFDSSKLTVTGSAVSGTKISYDLGTISSKIVITYDTKIVDEKILFENGGKGTTGDGNISKINFKNEAYLENKLTLDKYAETKGNQTVASNVLNKIAGNYNYNTGRIKWTIIVNKNEISLTNPILNDIIPEGMIYDDSTFSISPSISYTKDFAGGVLSVTFNGTITEAYTVTFETEVDKEFLLEQLKEGKNINVQFKNQSTLTDTVHGTVKANASVTVKNQVVEKEKVNVSSNQDYIEWRVPINKNKITFSSSDSSTPSIVMTDDLQQELELDVASVKLYKAIVGSGGTLTKGALVTNSNGEYKVIYENNIFTIEMYGTISEAYILEFTTDVLTKKATIENTIEFTGRGVKAQDKETDFSITVNEAGVIASGGVGSLRVYKIDDQDGKKLLGAQFRVHWKFNGSENGIRTGEVIVANDGFLFNELLYKTYYVEELIPPAGYLRDPELHPIRISRDDKDKEYEFPNKKAEADIEFIKQNNFGKNLSGVEFTLYGDAALTTKVAGPVASGQDGKVTFSKIAPGTYWIKETGTPAGYLPLANAIKVEVSIINNGTAMGVKFNDGQINAPYIATNDLIDGVIALKVDENGVYLKDALFGIYGINGGSSIQEIKSNENGTVLFENIKAGEYYIEEIIPPAGHTKSTERVYVKVVEDVNDSKKLIVSYKIGNEPYSDKPVEFVNKPINIEFIKKDSNENELAGAEFTLYEEDGETVFENRASVSSDVDGKVVFTKIPAGKYVIKETKAPSGYRDFNGTINVEVGVTDGGTKATVTFSEGEKSDYGKIEIAQDGKLVVTNERRPSTPNPTPVLGSIAIKKTDEDKKVLSGAEFTLYDEDGKVVDRGVTGSDGTLTFNDLEPGRYVLKETKAPEGYVLEVDETNVTVVANKTNTYTFTNKKEEPKKPGRIDIVKVDEEGTLLSDAWFSLIDSNGTTLQNAVTVNGRVSFEDVPVGRYRIEEVQAPDGYELTSQTVNVTVDSEETVALRFVNKKSGVTVTPVSGRIIINKVDEDNAPLAGAEFTLYNENNEIVGTAVSDASGRVVFDNLSDGRYFVKETEAPAGYRLVSDSLTVNVTGGSSNSYRFRNVPDTEDIGDPDIPLGWEEIEDPDVPRDGLPNTGSLLDTWLLITMGIMLIFAGMLLYRRKPINN